MFPVTKRLLHHHRTLTCLISLPNFISKRYKSDTLLGSVDWYSKHLFISIPESASEWPSNLEKSEDPNFNFYGQISKTAKANNLENTGKFELRVTGFESTSPSTAMLFPDLVKLTSLSPEKVPEIFKDNLGSLSHEKLPKKAIFICSHANKDKRCGLCGPAIFEAFEKNLKNYNLQDQVEIHKCSHFGGHKWAGNVIIFDKNGGNWYGTLKEENVPELIEEHLIKDKILWNHWRGKTGLSKEDAEALHAKHTIVS